MSDSEDEGAFASADEGDSPQKSTSKDLKSAADKQATKIDSKPEKDKSPTKTKSNISSSSSNTSQKEKVGGQKPTQQRQKKKGKGNQQSSSSKAKESPTVSASDSSSPTVSASDSSKQSSRLKEESVGNKVKADSQVSQVDTKKPQMEKCDKDKTPSSQESIVSKTIPQNPEPSRQKEESMTESKEETKSIMDDKYSEDSAQKEKSQPSAPSAEKSQGGGWGWGGWGSSLLSVASNSVQTFTHQLGDGLSTIIDTVESSLDDLVTEDKIKDDATTQPDKINDKTEEKKKDEQSENVQTSQPGPKDEINEEKKDANQDEANSGGANWFPSWGIASIAKKVSDTGKTLANKGQTLMTDGFDAVENLASGGIDVLESIGKKTYHTFSEHDPAFKKTREYLRSKNEKPNLSSVLKEAKEKAEMEAVKQEESEEARKAHFETQFDEYQGIAHLEALEILSNQSEKKVLSLLNSLSSDDHKVIKPNLIAIKQVFEVDSEMEETGDKRDEDFSALVNQHLSELKLGTAPDKLNKVHDMVKQWMADFEMQESHNTKEIHQQAIQSLAELTSKGVEQFHKAGELLLMQRDSEKDCRERAHSFARLTGVLCHEVGNLATKFTECLHKTATADSGDEGNVTTLVTNIYLEASNSTTYIQDAFQLLLPILQHAAIEHMILSRQT